VSPVRIFDGHSGDWDNPDLYYSYDVGRVGPYVPREHEPEEGKEPPAWRNVDTQYIEDVPIVLASYEEVYFG
jgi:hypothetical protein